MTASKVSPEIWETKDGHLFTSIPTEEPRRWTLIRVETPGAIAYQCGDYEIQREPYRSHFVYSVYRKGIRISLGEFGRLMDAKTYAIRNAQGEDRVNVA